LESKNEQQMNLIKLALVGCGRVSKRHIEAVQAVEGIDIAVVCDIDKIIFMRRLLVMA
jgi:predicted homoserine dehydrogenase-like protein